MRMQATVCGSLAGLLLGVTMAGAGEKVQANLVPTNSPNPTLLASSKASISDAGQLLAVVKGLKDASGAIVNGDASLKGGVLTGDEYVAIFKGVFAPAATPVSFEFNLPIEFKNGNGVSKTDASALFALTGPLPQPHSVQITGIEIWGPLGAANTAACQAILSAALPAVLPPAPNACKQGSLVGVGGIQVP